LSHDGTNAHLDTDTEGDWYFFSGNESGENYEVRVYGYISAATAGSFFAMNLDDTNDEALFDMADGSADTTLDFAVQLDDAGGSSVFRIRDSGSNEVFYIDSNGNLSLGGAEAATDYTLTFNGETNDGVLTWMEDEAAFSFDNKIGIGDTTPDSALEVVSAGDDYFMISSYDGGDGNVLIVDSTGYVGINDTSPSEKLEVTGNIRLTSDSDELQFGAAQDYVIDWDGSDAVHTISAGDFVFTGGDVGVGTATPNRKFHVYSSTSAAARIYIEADPGDSGPGIEFAFDNTATRRGLIRLNEVGTTGTEFAFWTIADGGSITEKMRLQDSGGLSLGAGYLSTDPGAGSLIVESKVGIGDTTPDSALEVVSAGDDYFMISSDDSLDGAPGMWGLAQEII